MLDYLEVCERAARAGGQELLSWMDRFQITEKGPADFVTQADLASQEAIRDIVLGAFPGHAFLSEEEPRDYDAACEYCWITDPLDGTLNYVHQVPHFCVSLALARAGEILVGAIFDPVSGDCYRAAAGQGAYLNGRRLAVSKAARLSDALVAVSFPPRIAANSPMVADFVNVLVASQSIRRTGSAALNLCYVAAGRFDAFWAKHISAWDIAAGVLFVREAGGVVTAIDGSPFTLQRPPFIAAATKPLHAELLAIVAKTLPLRG